jgi:hypothetical protein
MYHSAQWLSKRNSRQLHISRAIWPEVGGLKRFASGLDQGSAQLFAKVVGLAQISGVFQQQSDGFPLMASALDRN